MSLPSILSCANVVETLFSIYDLIVTGEVKDLP